MSPPGMAFLSVSERAWAAAEQSTVPKFYFDLRKARTQVQGPAPSTPFTTAISIAYGVHAAVGLILDEGLTRVFDRHRRMARLVRAGVRGMGLATLVEDADAVDTVTLVVMPQGVEGRTVVARARDAYDVLLGGGIGRLDQSTMRIGHLGYTKTEWLLTGLETLGRTLGDLGHPVDTGAGLAAARRTLETTPQR